MIQLNGMQLTSQTPNHVEMTANVKEELLSATACLEYSLSKTNRTHGYKIQISSRLQGYCISFFTGKKSLSTTKYLLS